MQFLTCSHHRATEEYPRPPQIQYWTCQQHLLGTYSKADAPSTLQAHMHTHCMVSTTCSKCDRPWQQHTLPGKPWLVTWQHRPCLTQHRNLHLSTLAPFPSTPKSLPPLWKCIPWCAGNTGANIPCPAVNQVTLTGFTLYFIYHLISVQQNEMQGVF